MCNVPDNVLTEHGNKIIATTPHVLHTMCVNKFLIIPTPITYICWDKIVSSS